MTYLALGKDANKGLRDLYSVSNKHSTISPGKVEYTLETGFLVWKVLLKAEKWRSGIHISLIIS